MESKVVSIPTVNIVCPETILGRKMTEEEINKILDDIKKVNIEIFKYRMKKRDLENN